MYYEMEMTEEQAHQVMAWRNEEPNGLSYRSVSDRAFEAGWPVVRSNVIDGYDLCEDAKKILADLGIEFKHD